ncbi:DEAD/DEAH box helicase domain protein [Nitzschia inconspicua]|uniref:ATP-dependent RNA helicase n=1 Tax=Nitzschia inconspicua TaxID=303405 RepID=A0A9K3LHT3_9STRA|nr:DEAD/DEAH box helicase domain protein [Nitzschia inconspicua]
MTQIQARTYKPALEGKSIMASSRTGSGKTIAFLLPSIERLLKHDLDIYRPGRSIGVIILSPTRELAIQIANQAQELLQYLPKANQLPVACLYGGVKMQRDIRLLTGGTSPARLPAIVVSTPGRLIDHLEGNTRLGPGHNNKFATILDGTKIVILDEMDRLWETHQKETKQILTVLARSNKRQTLLFSATFSRPLRRLLKESILKGQQVYEVDCIQDGDDGHDENANANGAVGSGTINKRIQQSYVLIDNMAQYTEILLTILRRELLQDNHFKILVFFPTSRMVRFFHQLFTMGKINLGRRQQQRGKHDTGSRNNKRETLLWEIHSHMSQSSRTRASESFRNAKRGILFSTDVSARGMDYPDVTLVVQMGAPTKESQYIHRLGRSGRAGQSGKGILVLLPFEAKIPTLFNTCGTMNEDKELKNWLDDDSSLDPENIPATETSLLQECQHDLESTLAKIRSGHAVLTPSAEAACKVATNGNDGSFQNWPEKEACSNEKHQLKNSCRWL